MGTSEQFNGPPSEAESEQAAPTPQPAKWAGLQKRVATSLLIAAISIPFLWFGGWILTAALILLAIQMNREWESLIPENCPIWRIVGIFYVTIPIICLIILRGLEFMESEAAAFYLTLYPIIIISVTDISAYFSGKTLGGPLLAAKLSPNKTWAGLLGAVIGASLAAVCMLPLTVWPQTLTGAIALGAAMALLAQAGDLFESSLKRRFNVKDSGRLLPGHGGVLDRLDGYLFVLPVYLALVLMQVELLP